MVARIAEKTEIPYNSAHDAKRRNLRREADAGREAAREITGAMMIAQGQYWNKTQVDDLKKLIGESEMGKNPVFIKEWPGPVPSGTLPYYRWMRFVDLPMIKSIGRGLYSVELVMEPVPGQHIWAGQRRGIAE